MRCAQNLQPCLGFLSLRTGDRKPRVITFSKHLNRIFELRQSTPLRDTNHVMLHMHTQKMVMCCCCTCRVSSGDGVQSS